MRLILPIILICSSQFVFSQNRFNWNDYIPGGQVDSILLLSTNKDVPSLKEKGDENTQQDSDDLLREVLLQAGLPLNDFTHYLEIYELKKTVKDTKGIRAIINLFPKMDCEHLPSVRRCLAVYRDCAVFYRKGIPIGALKICFACTTVDASPPSRMAKCLAESDHFRTITQKWIELGQLDLAARP
ncbi:MAG: hypothetical protein AAFX87_02095 [Bacteroidota bacterium]